MKHSLGKQQGISENGAVQAEVLEVALRWEHSLHIMSLDGAVNPLHPVSYDFFKKVFFFLKKTIPSNSKDNRAF